MHSSLGSDGVLGKEVVDCCRRDLCALRRGDRIDKTDFERILKAVTETRRDLARRPRVGGVYRKMLDELAAKHVLVWCLPRRVSSSQEVVKDDCPLMSARTSRSAGSGATVMKKKPSVFGSARNAALVRSHIRVYVPRFLVALLNLEDCGATRLYLARPELFLTLDNFLVMPNPAYFDFDAFVHDPKRAALESKKKSGFGLVAWWVHPELKKHSRFFIRNRERDTRINNAMIPRLRNQAPALVPPPFLRRPDHSPKKLPDASKDRGFAIAVDDLLNSTADAAPYLYDVSDLDSSHRPELSRLAHALEGHLSLVYGVNDLSSRDLYFHRQHALWNAPDRAWALTLHLHVAVYRARTPACFCHSISLADVITFLKDPQHGPALVAGTHNHASADSLSPRKQQMRTPPRDPEDFLLPPPDTSPRPSAPRPYDLPILHKRGHFELLNMPADPDHQRQVITLLQYAGFLVSEPLSPADLAFDDLLVYAPAPDPAQAQKRSSPSSVLQSIAMNEQQ